MKEKLEKINREISPLSDTIKDTEIKMKANDISLLQVRKCYFCAYPGKAFIFQKDSRLHQWCKCFLQQLFSDIYVFQK